jgi:hypothetical protein
MCEAEWKTSPRVPSYGEQHKTEHIKDNNKNKNGGITCLFGARLSFLYLTGGQSKVWYCEQHKTEDINNGAKGT